MYKKKMYCILVAGLPASGKTVMADVLSKDLGIPVISKDKIKEIMYDTVGFHSRKEKVALGVASMEIMYYMAEQHMKCGLPFILENNFEHISREGLEKLLCKYGYHGITVLLTGDDRILYQRFVARNGTAERHRGHVVNDCYPEKERREVPPMSYEAFVNGFTERGMDNFSIGDSKIIVDTTDFKKVDYVGLLRKIKELIDKNP